ncbi:hypothetical protein OG535_03345 [Kitasatospora sp. NBC_00085]|uniref:hypothetical protein n=1 Tax=unclassified Kitasatospora TaxID=2633591 RepID=UPI00325574A6
MLTIREIFEPLMRPGGALADSVGLVLGAGPGRGAGLLLVLVGALPAVWGLLGLAYRPLRLIEDLLPDALPDAEIGDKDAIQAAADRQLSLARAARPGGTGRAAVPRQARDGAAPEPVEDEPAARVPAGTGPR